ncbi:Transmembrane protein, partial [Schistosoma japonicum]
VNDLKVISDKPYTKCSYSRVISDLTSANDLISVHASVPRILHPHETTSLLKATVNANESKIIQISSSICEYSQFKPYHIPSGNSANYIVSMKSVNKISSLPSSVISINELPDQVYNFSKYFNIYIANLKRCGQSSLSTYISKVICTHVLAFCILVLSVVNQVPFSIPIEVLFLGDQPLEITVSILYMFFVMQQSHYFKRFHNFE